MAKTKKKTTRRGEDSSAEATDYNPFLKADEVLSGGELFSMTGWTRRLPGRYGEQIVVELTRDRDGKMFDFAFRDGSMNHRKMFKQAGPDPRKWLGKLLLTVSRVKNGGEFVDIKEVQSDNVPF